VRKSSAKAPKAFFPRKKTSINWQNSQLSVANFFLFDAKEF
jgi:hypothetical protein